MKKIHQDFDAVTICSKELKSPNLQCWIYQFKKKNMISSSRNTNVIFDYITIPILENIESDLQKKFHKIISFNQKTRISFKNL